MNCSKKRSLPAVLLCVLLMSASLLAGCGRAQAVEDDGRLKVVTTLFPYYDFVRQVAGDRVDSILIVPAGMDSHSFEPTPADMITIENADILIRNGGAMEHWLDEVLESLDTSHMEIVTMMDYVEVSEEEIVEGMEAEAHDHEAEGHDHEAEDHDHQTEDPDHAHDGYELEIEYDEHIWTSPVNAGKLAAVISQTIQEVLPEEADWIARRTESYQADLADLDKTFREITENAPHNLFVVADKFPFRYLAQEYGLSYRAAFTGCSSDTEPSARTIAYLIDKIRDEQIPVVYYLELSSHSTALTISEETGAKPLLLHSCHSVTRREFDQGITYLQLMRQNAENLRQGLY